MILWPRFTCAARHTDSSVWRSQVIDGGDDEQRNGATTVAAAVTQAEHRKALSVGPSRAETVAGRNVLLPIVIGRVRLEFR